MWLVAVCFEFAHFGSGKKYPPLELSKIRGNIIDSYVYSLNFAKYIREEERELARAVVLGE